MSPVNPLSGGQFLKSSMRVATTHGAGSSKTKKDTGATQKEQGVQQEFDQVTLSGKMTAKQKANLAAQSGTTSETAKKQKKKDADELHMFGGDAEGMEGERSGAATAQGKKEGVEEMTAAKKTKLQKILDRKPEEIMNDVPQEFAASAGKIVEGQIKKGEPADSLTNLKEVPDTAMPELDPAPDIEIADIHDSSNKPIRMDSGAQAGVA